MKIDIADNKNQGAILQAILKYVRFDDPHFKSFIKQEISNYYKSGPQKEIQKEIIRRLRIQNKKLLEQVASLKEQLKQVKTGKNEMQIRLNYLAKLNNSLAGALGSCDVCWGDDPDCVKCDGNGSPAWHKINRRLFNIYVLPTLEKIYGLGEKARRAKQQ